MKVFVVGGYIPNGGTYMAYHVALLLSQAYGLDGIVVRVGLEERETSLFEYPSNLPLIDMPTFERTVGECDLIIANPSFSSRLFGLRLPGTKLMYAQGFNTFQIIDGFFDHYVSVSSFVSDFLRSVYRIVAPVIPAFIRTDLVPSPTPWHLRAPNRVLSVGKQHFPDFLQRFKRILAERHPKVDLDFVPLPAGISHSEVFQLMNESRFVLGLSACEGFGLLPLEAMACGCAYVGFDGVGGRDYMESGSNCEAVCYPDIPGLADRIAGLYVEPDRARLLAEHGAEDARRFDYVHFRARWLRYFQDNMGIVGVPNKEV